MIGQSVAISWNGMERRGVRDRRARPLWHKAALSVKGSRRYARRAGDGDNYYVDRYSMRWMAVSLSIIFLCCLDAFFTLDLIRLGMATEANPFMRVLMEHNITVFLVVKYLLTIFGLFVLLMHKNFKVFNRIKVGHILLGFAVMYIFLIKYELWLFSLVD